MMFLDSHEDVEKIENYWNTNGKPSQGNSSLSKVKTSKNTCLISNEDRFNKKQEIYDDYDNIREMHNRRSNHFKEDIRYNSKENCRGKNLKKHCNEN